jgi:hypothetical protein
MPRKTSSNNKNSTFYKNPTTTPVNNKLSTTPNTQSGGIMNTVKDAVIYSTVFSGT